MLDLQYDYASCTRNSEKISWKLDEVMPPDTRLDFARPFLPEALVPTKKVKSLSTAEQLKLNHIASNAYLNLFAFVEEYIVATTVQHAQAEMFGDHNAIRALVRFAEEEVKHQQLFWRYRDAFARDFGFTPKVLEGAAEVAGVIMSKSPIAVMIITLHLELMTQQHYTDCVRDDTGVDPFFARLLKHHWLEEAQHARIDALELDKLLDTASPDVIKAAFDDYIGLLQAVDGLLAAQAGMDCESLGTLLGRTFTEAEAKEIKDSQIAGYRYTFLTSGMRNKQFQDTIAKISPTELERIVAHAKTLS